HFPQIKIIWDPVMKASSGFEFHSTISKSVLTQCCQKVFLLTPNADEALALTNETDAVLAAEQLQQVTQVFMKSFKMKDGSMYDVLLQQGTRLNFKSEVLDGFEKHGSGCVLSAAITAFLALGNDLKTSCELAKSYTFEFLQSAPGLLGTHHAIKLPVQHG
ncbi:MAG: bifunctional hydroxymethylpyrimidine kinase/phosphomethylpyrimidine kinase, partial [Chitinophagales bacterium]